MPDEASHDRGDDGVSSDATQLPKPKKRKKKTASAPIAPPEATAESMPTSIRYGLAGGAFGTCLGIAWEATKASSFGAWLIVLSTLSLIVAIHRLGRLGPMRRIPAPPAR